MSVNQQDIETIHELLVPAFGEKAWATKLSTSGRYIVVEFGDPTPVIGDPNTIAGKWHLVTNACAWRLEKNGGVLTGSLDVPSFVPSPEYDKDGSQRANAKEQRFNVEQALQELDGLSLQTVEVQRPAFDTIFTFDNSVKLHFFSVVFFGNEDGSVTWRHWSFYMPDGRVLIIGPGTNWSVKKYRKAS